MKTNVPAKKKALGTLSISKEWMASVGIDNIDYVDVLFWAYADDYKSFDTGVVKTLGDHILVTIPGSMNAESPIIWMIISPYMGS